MNKKGVNIIDKLQLLAIKGGKPVRKQLLPYGRQWIGWDDIIAMVKVLRGDYLTTGPIVQQFEQQIARYVGAEYAVAFGSGTAALHAACYAAGIETGDEVITSSMTFAASANCILYRGGIPVFADIDERTGNIGPTSIESKITPKTKAIIPVHFAGQPAEMTAIMRLAKQHGLIVIEDGAHALGAVYRDLRVGSIGHMTMFSFHPVKPITTGEGGVITTNDYTYYQRLVQFRSHGINKSPESLAQHGDWYYEMQFLGYNYRLTDIQAALGISQLKKIDKYHGLRKEYARIYNAAFKDVQEMTTLFQHENVQSAWHIYIIRLNFERLTGSRKEIYDALKAENIGVNVHYIPVYLHPYYQELGYAPGLCPKSEQLYEEMVTLPLFPSMKRKDIQDVIHAVKKVLRYYAIT